jgi:hypothetical protein
MADYQSLMQPVAQGLLTIDAAGDPVIVGQGFALVERGTAPAGDFLITLDSGIGVADIGSGNVANEPGFGYPDGTVGPNGLDPRLAHVSLTVRGGTGGLTLGATQLSNLSASFVTAPDTGALQISIQTSSVPALGGQQDPSGPGAPNINGSGLEIMVWKLATPDNVTQQAFGPLYQNAMQFP